MPSKTKNGLNLAGRGEYVRVEENINDNLLKIDDDVDATWGGEYGGYIQDTAFEKVVGKRYIDQFNKKAYICNVVSHVNTTENYTECNVVNNLDKIANIDIIQKSYGTNQCFIKYSDGRLEYWGVDNGGKQSRTVNFPEKFKDTNYRVQLTKDQPVSITYADIYAPVVKSKTRDAIVIVPHGSGAGNNFYETVAYHVIGFWK